MSTSSEHGYIDHILRNPGIFVCPRCSGDLAPVEDVVRCDGCEHVFPVEDGIPLLFWPNDWNESKEDVTDIVRSFYEETPFPNYEKLETVNDLIEKAREGGFARLLDEQVPNVRVLEVGCGTGQLSNFLGIRHRAVFGTDLCVNSLRLGAEFRSRNGLDRVGFYQMNLFRPIFRQETFPLVISNGVLHHTSDPERGFQSIAKLVRRGGFIIIGLYHRYGRLITDARRAMFKASGDRLQFLDPRLRSRRVGAAKKNAWFQDQYKHPHESKHTVGEVLRWFDDAGFEFVNGIPKVIPFERVAANERLFNENSSGSGASRFLAQAKWILQGGREGGLFVMIGRRRD